MNCAGACVPVREERREPFAGGPEEEGVVAAALERGAPNVLVILADISDAEQSRRAVEATVTHFGKRTRPSLYLSRYVSILHPAHGVMVI
jgi:NAD(P)-dependent dehydrogenase (short-subunit alcohol dehydrogenase family)